MADLAYPEYQYRLVRAGMQALALSHEDYLKQNKDVYLVNPEQVYQVSPITCKDVLLAAMAHNDPSLLEKNSLLRLTKEKCKEFQALRKEWERLQRKLGSAIADARTDADMKEVERKLKELTQFYKEQYQDVRHIYNFQNRHLALLLQAGEIEKLRALLPEYMEFNSDEGYFGTVHDSLKKDFQHRWAFWVQKLI